jgi:hypothetical protein
MLNSPPICCGSSKTLAGVAAEPGSSTFIAAAGGSFLPYVPDAPDMVERNAPTKETGFESVLPTPVDLFPLVKASQYILLTVIGPRALTSGSSRITVFL